MLTQPNHVSCGSALQCATTGNIALAHICDSDEDAHALLRSLRVHQPHLGKYIVVSVRIVVETVPDDPRLLNPIRSEK